MGSRLKKRIHRSKNGSEFLISDSDGFIVVHGRAVSSVNLYDDDNVYWYAEPDGAFFAPVGSARDGTSDESLASHACNTPDLTQLQ